MRQDRSFKKVSDHKMNSFLNKKVSFEGTFLLVVNFADIFHTAFLIELGLAAELNPVIKLLLKHGMPVFLAWKIVVIGILILALELLRGGGKNSKFVKLCQWVAIIAYPSLIFLANFVFPYLKILWKLG
jgi:hypothetical protein